MSTPGGPTEPSGPKAGVGPRRALIVSGRFGKGHDTVAEACATALAPLGVESRIVDAIALLGGAASQAGERVFRTILDRPSIYDAFHFNQLRPGGWLARRMDGASLRVMWPHFVSLCNDWPPDLIVSVFATGAAAAPRYQRLHPEVTTAVFITDATAHALWVHRGIDVYLVPSRLGELAVRRYVPDAHVRLVTHPTRPEFTTPPTREAARRTLDIPVDADCVLMMSGAWGIGPVAEGAEALARQGIWVLAVAGSNERLERSLRAVAGRDPKVVPFGFTDRVPELMAAADIVVSSSGDTCREALRRRPQPAPARRGAGSRPRKPSPRARAGPGLGHVPRAVRSRGVGRGGAQGPRPPPGRSGGLTAGLGVRVARRAGLGGLSVTNSGLGGTMPS